MIYNKVAKRLAELGYAVTPLKGKRPIINDWEKTTHETITTDSRFDNCNIGLLCGSPSGLIVVDVDTFDSDLESKLYAVMPETPLMKKGAKGINFFYRFNGEETIKLHNPKDKRKVELEIISTGRQTVIPRSIHPDTKKPYFWCDKNGKKVDKHLLNTNIEEIPRLRNEDIDLLRLTVSEHYLGTTTERSAQGVAGLLENSDTSVPHTSLDDYNPKTIADIPEGYRDRCRSGSHDHLINIMFGMINAGRPEEEILDRVLNEDAKYNVGYASNYFNCRTCNVKGDTARDRAKYFLHSTTKTVGEKKELAGEAMPVVHQVIETDGLKDMEAVNTVLNEFGIKYDFISGNRIDTGKEILMKEGKKDLFYYDGKKWNHCEQGFFDVIYRKLNHLFGYKKPDATVMAAVNKFIKHVPSIPKSMSFFESNPFMVNFKNGTLHLNEVDGKQKLEFRPHSKSDYCTNMIGIDYTNSEVVNEEFDAMLNRIFELDQDKADKILAIQEMFGAALMPAYPRLFFCHGDGGSGKSTIAKILKHLIGEDNLCSVDPSSFDGFNMESMVNKLVNLDSDIDSSKPISDGVVKKIEDRGKIRVRRKGIEDINAHIPAIHIFMANNLPKNFDGTSGAHERRWTFVKFNRNFTTGRKWDKDFDRRVFNSCPQGVLRFAISGLQRLISNGWHFTNPDSGRQNLRSWLLENDIVGQFVADIENREVELDTGDIPEVRKDLMIKKKDLFTTFMAWTKEVNKKNTRLGRNKFYELLDKKGFHAKRDKVLGAVIEGIGIPDTPSPEN